VSNDKPNKTICPKCSFKKSQKSVNVVELFLKNITKADRILSSGVLLCFWWKLDFDKPFVKG